MTREEILNKARQHRKSKLIFDSKEYSIKKIHLNYKIDIKLPKKMGCKTINRDCYSFLGDGLDCAHKVANEMIGRYFTDGIQSKLGQKA